MKDLVLRRCLIVLVLCLMPILAQATTRYVSTSGSDSNSCAASTSTSTPKRNISGGSGGLACMSAGDTLYIRGGTYDEHISSNNQTIPVGTSWSNAITIASYPGETATIAPTSGTEVITLFQPYIQYIIFDRLVIDCAGLQGGGAPGTYQNYSLSTGEGANHIRFSNGEMKNGEGAHITMYGKTVGGNVVTYSAGNEILNNLIHDASYSYGAYVSNNDNLFEGNSIYNNGGYGIQIFNGYGTQNDNNIIRNNRIFNNGFVRGYGAMTVNHGNGTKIYNNLIYSNYTGIDVGSGNQTGVMIDNNTFYNQSNWSVAVSPGNIAVELKNNIFYQNSSNILGSGNETIEANNLTTNPLFVNASGADFHLQSSSPAINTGVCLPAVPTDIAGVSRPQGAGCDVGAYEFGGTVSPLAVSLTASPTSRTVGQLTTATWNVTTGNANAVDYVALFLVGDSPANKVANDGAGLIGWTYTNGANSGTFPTTVPNLAPGASVSYEFRYCVNDSTTCIATSQTVTVTGPVIAAPNIVLSRAGMSVSPSPAGCDSAEISSEDGRCLNVLDSNPSTIWTTVWSTTPPVQPHQIIINLGGSYAVSGWIYLPRQDGCSNGSIIGWSLYVSTDGTTWGASLATGTFAATATEKVVLAGSTQVGNYMKIVSSSAIGPGDCAWPGTDVSGPWSTAAEIYVLINPGATSYAITQARYRWFAADGGLLPGCGENQVCGAAPGETRQLRVKVTATLANPPLLSLQLYCRVNAAAFAVVPVNGSAGVNVCMGLGIGFISGQSTNRALTLDQAAFLPGAYVALLSTVQSIDLSQNSESEYVWFIATPPGLSSGTTVDCKVVFSDGSSLQAYTVNPTEVLQNAQLRLGGTLIGGVTVR